MLDLVPGSLDEEVCFAIELKPKCGFLPQSEFIAKRNAIKKHVTRFKMHQILKLHQRQISQLSEYNPLDLFSGNKQKISRAILALFTTPQNNFRIFLNGSLIFGGLGGSMDNVAHGFQNTNGEIENIKTIGGLHFASIVEFIAEAIFSSSILARLLNAQKLDVFDIEGAIHAYYNILSQPCLACRNSVDADLLDRYSFLHSLSLEESFELVRNYLISATAKDCSLMISFRPMKESDATELSVLHLKESNQSFEYKVNFVDLDMKPLHKMDHYYKLDQKIYDDLPIDAFMEYVLQFVAFHMKDFFIHKKHNAEPDAVDLLMEASSRFINIAYLSITCVISVNTLAFFLNPDGRILMCYAFISSS